MKAVVEDLLQGLIGKFYLVSFEFVVVVLLFLIGGRHGRQVLLSADLGHNYARSLVYEEIDMVLWQQIADFQFKVADFALSSAYHEAFFGPTDAFIV